MTLEDRKADIEQKHAQLTIDKLSYKAKLKSVGVELNKLEGEHRLLTALIKENNVEESEK